LLAADTVNCTVGMRIMEPEPWPESLQ